jgi:hypothetical protein
LQYCIGGFGPNERLGALDEGGDIGLELTDAAMDAA